MRKILTSFILLGAGVWVGWCASQAVPRHGAAPRAVSPRGHLVTNYHVIEGAEVVEAALSDGTRRKARVVGVAPE